MLKGAVDRACIRVLLTGLAYSVQAWYFWLPFLHFHGKVEVTEIRKTKSRTFYYLCSQQLSPAQSGHTESFCKILTTATDVVASAVQREYLTLYSVTCVLFRASRACSESRSASGSHCSFPFKLQRHRPRTYQLNAFAPYIVHAERDHPVDSDMVI